MNKHFLEDLERNTGFRIEVDPVAAGSSSHYALQLYIAEKLWELVQYAKNQEQR